MMIDQNTKTIILNDEEMQLVYCHAEKVMLGGKSHVRGAERGMTLSEDQIVGQAGEAALSKVLTGNIELYNQTRLEREKNVRLGDGGTDLLGMNTDVKTSRMRAGNDHLYYLWVRPQEYNPETYYYLALVPVGKNATVHFVGWVQGKYMPYVNGRYQLRQDELNSMFAGEEE